MRLKRWEERALWFQAGRCAVGGSALVRPKHEKGRGIERVSPASSACEPTLQLLSFLLPSFQATGRTGASKRTLLRSCIVASCVATCDVHLSNENSLESNTRWCRRSLRDSSTATVHLHRISSIDPPSVQGLWTDRRRGKGGPVSSIPSSRRIDKKGRGSGEVSIPLPQRSVHGDRTCVVDNDARVCFRVVANRNVARASVQLRFLPWPRPNRRCEMRVGVIRTERMGRSGRKRRVGRGSERCEGSTRRLATDSRRMLVTTRCGTT